MLIIHCVISCRRAGIRIIRDYSDNQSRSQSELFVYIPLHILINVIGIRLHRFKIDIGHYSFLLRSVPQNSLEGTAKGSNNKK